MPMYMLLTKLTDHGIKTIKESPARVDAVKQLFKRVGGEVNQLYAALGTYDFCVIVNAPDDETVARACFAIGSWGAARTETLRLFAERDYRENIVAKLP